MELNVHVVKTHITIQQQTPVSAKAFGKHQIVQTAPIYVPQDNLMIGIEVNA